MEGIGIFACPQAQTVSEYKSLLFAMTTFKEVTTIGLSKKAIPYVYGIKKRIVISISHVLQWYTSCKSIL